MYMSSLARVMLIDVTARFKATITADHLKSKRPPNSEEWFDLAKRRAAVAIDVALGVVAARGTLGRVYVDAAFELLASIDMTVITWERVNIGDGKKTTVLNIVPRLDESGRSPRVWFFLPTDMRSEFGVLSKFQIASDGVLLEAVPYVTRMNQVMQNNDSFIMDAAEIAAYRVREARYVRRVFECFPELKLNVARFVNVPLMKHLGASDDTIAALRMDRPRDTVGSTERETRRVDGNDRRKKKNR